MVLNKFFILIVFSLRISLILYMWGCKILKENLLFWFEEIEDGDEGNYSYRKMGGFWGDSCRGKV